MANIILDGRREEKLKSIFANIIKHESRYSLDFWNLYVEEDIFDDEELEYMKSKYEVVVTLVKK